MASTLSRVLFFQEKLSKFKQIFTVQFIQSAWASSRSKLGKPGEFRMDKDTLGEMKVPADKYYGSETQRSVLYFPSGGDNERMPFPLISAIGIIKKATANANRDYGLDCEIATNIEKAAEEVMCGDLYCNHFPVSIWQAGAATNSHINTNEVIANRAIEMMGGEIGSKCPVHPNDHVNMGQSTNDVIPSAIHIALTLELHNNTLPGVKMLHEELQKKSEEWCDIIKVGRTHLMDATPISLGQEFGGYAAQIDDGIKRIEDALPGLYQLQMGGTAVGTGLNAGCGFGKKVVELISKYTGLPFVEACNKITGCACLDHVVHLSAALCTLSCSLMKVVNDIRHMSSGPRCGIGELIIPEKEPGSSIMPGKVNPTQCEPVLMISALTIGNHVATTIGGANGNWELNLYKPLIFTNTLRSCRLIGHVCKAFTKNCLCGAVPNKAKIEMMLQDSLMNVTALSPHIGYDKTAQIAVTAHKESITLKESAKKHGVKEEDFDNWLKPEEMIHCTENFKAGARRDCKKKDTCKKIPPPPEVMEKIKSKSKVSCSKKKETCQMKQISKKAEDTCKKKKDPCKKKKDSCKKKKHNTCKKEKDTCKKKEDPCKKKKEDPCKKKKDDPCKKKKDDPCKKKKEDPCKKKKEDPCKKKKEDPCKKKKDDPCKKKKDDPCKKKKDDPCKKKKNDPCKKKKDDPCKKKKDDPCKKKKDDPCKKKKDDPCKKKKDDPCKKKKGDPCKKKKDDPCKKKKDDPCKKKKKDFCPKKYNPWKKNFSSDGSNPLIVE